MFKSKILFVVGAGASQEAGLPTGNELTATIANKMDIKFNDISRQISGDRKIIGALMSHFQAGDGGNINPYLLACWHIRDAMPQASSIDSFIDQQGDDKIELCGKLAIVRSILEAEKNSLLFFDEREANPRLNFNKLRDTWYNIFMQILDDGRRKENINQLFEDVYCITFNYDRCIEHFLFNALRNYYRIKPDEAADIMQGFKILHPYGMVGRMRWQGAGVSTEFGADLSGESLLSLSEQIKTYTERVEDEEAITEMRKVVQDAEIIVFLGFAFHPLNMALIRPATRGNAKRIFTTTRGISDSGCEIVQKQILELCGSKPHIYLKTDLSCHGLFKEYWRSLSLS